MRMVKFQLVVFRRNRGMALRPVHRIKHVIDLQGAIASGAGTNVTLILAKDAPVLANSNEVETGSKVNGIYLKIEAVKTSVTSGVLANVYLVVFKNPGGNLANLVPNAVGISDDKRYAIHQEMIMLEQQQNSNPRILFNGVIVIPRGYKRFGPNDSLIARLLTPGADINFCVQAHYKEFR